MKYAITILLGLLPCVTIFAADPPATGDSTIHLAEKSPFSDPVKITKRTAWSLEDIKKKIPIDYDLKDETFSLHVPESYKGDEPYGLMVWVSAGDKGEIPRQFREVADKRKIIWIGANKSGNPRAMLVRMELAFDAVVGMKAQYKIDDKRIYIAGVSGGGKMAAIMGVGYPEIFNGGFYFIGAEYFRELPTGEPNHYFPRAFNAPEPKLLLDSKKKSRHVLMTGETDMNRKPIQVIYNGMKTDKFEHITLLDIPGVGHQLPDAEWFEKGMAALDEIPPDKTATKPVNKFTPGKK